MAVATIYQTKQPASSKHSSIIVYVLIVIGFLALAYFGSGFVKNMSLIGGKAALKTELFFGEGEVFIDGTPVGQIPYESKDVKPGDRKVVIAGNGVEYEVGLNFLPSTEVILKRDLGSSTTFSAGQNFWLEKSDGGTVLSIISEPSDADIFIDGTKVGTTPYSSSDLSPGDYDLKVEKRGYEPQLARIDISEDHRLNVSATLFPRPVPLEIKLLEGSSDLYDINSDNLIVSSDPHDWVKAVIYWNQTRGINLSDAGVNKDKVFDYFLDYDGNLYSAEGNRVSAEEANFIADAERGAYLRKVSDGEGLSEKAKETFLVLGEVGFSGKTATVLETGVGWLRVRDQPGLDGTEVTKVNVGESYSVLEEVSGWVKIQVSDDVEGWVSDIYVDIGGSVEEAAEVAEEDVTVAE